MIISPMLLSLARQFSEAALFGRWHRVPPTLSIGKYGRVLRTVATAKVLECFGVWEPFTVHQDFVDLGPGDNPFERRPPSCKGGSTSDKEALAHGHRLVKAWVHAPAKWL
jgi:hypothetical protein